MRRSRSWKLMDPHDLVVCGIITVILVSGAAMSAPLEYDHGQPPMVQFTVGFGGALPPIAALDSAGAKIVKVSPSLGVLVVSAPAGFGLSSQSRSDAGVTYVEPNGVIRADGASWDGASWDGASWDGASWDGASWDGASWDGASWDGASWDGASWDGASWDGASWDGASWDGTSWDGSADGYEAMDPGYPLQWGLGAINAPGAWDHTVGKRDRVICVVDSGVDYAHPDLAANMWTSPRGTHGYNAITGVEDPMDDAGHGTHVAGIAAAASGNGIGVSGVAQALIMGVKVLAANGEGTEADVAIGLAWCADHGAHVALMSLSTDVDAKVLRDAVKYAKSKGVLMVASAGNSGCECARYPAAYEDVLAVGALKQDGTRAGFSNTGKHLFITAPGHRIVSTLPDDRYVAGSGTSQAAPHVAGIAALAWGANPTLPASAVREALRSSATDLGESGRDGEYGFGAANAHGAVHAALRAGVHAH